MFAFHSRLPSGMRSPIAQLVFVQLNPMPFHILKLSFLLLHSELFYAVSLTKAGDQFPVSSSTNQSRPSMRLFLKIICDSSYELKSRRQAREKKTVSSFRGGTVNRIFGGRKTNALVVVIAIFISSPTAEMKTRKFTLGILTNSR